MSRSTGINSTAILLPFGWPFGVPLFYRVTNGKSDRLLAEEKTYQVSCENFFEGNLSADALSISACLISYSHLSFGGDAYAHNYADQFYKLREFMLDHPEVKAILGATD